VIVCRSQEDSPYEYKNENVKEVLSEEHLPNVIANSRSKEAAKRKDTGIESHYDVEGK